MCHSASRTILSCSSRAQRAKWNPKFRAIPDFVFKIRNGKEIGGLKNIDMNTNDYTIYMHTDMDERWWMIVCPGVSCGFLWVCHRHFLFFFASSLEVHCLYPFQGPPTVAECPLDNLDPAGLRWRPPEPRPLDLKKLETSQNLTGKWDIESIPGPQDCVQFCPDPEVSAVPAGYYKTGQVESCKLSSFDLLFISTIA